MFRKAVVLLCGLLLSTACLASESPVVIGSEAPDYLGKSYEGDAFLASAYRGKVVVATFWASWCGPCQRELPLLEGIQKFFGEDKVKVVAISIENKNKFRQIGKAAQSLALKFVHDADRKVYERYGVNGVPHLVVIGKDGKIKLKYVGYSESEVEQVVAKIRQAIEE